MKEERPLGLIQKSMLAAKTLLLGDPRDRKRLAWKSGCEEVKVRDFRSINLCYVASWGFPKPRAVGLAGEFIPFARKKTLPTDPLQPETKTADPGEEVCEGKSGRVTVSRPISLIGAKKVQLPIRFRAFLRLDYKVLNKLAPGHVRISAFAFDPAMNVLVEGIQNQGLRHIFLIPDPENTLFKRKESNSIQSKCKAKG